MTLGRSLLIGFFAAREDETRAGLAARLGVTRALVTMWLSGDRTPGRRNVFALERETGIPAASWDEECPAPKRARKAPRGRRAA